MSDTETTRPSFPTQRWPYAALAQRSGDIPTNARQCSNCSHPPDTRIGLDYSLQAASTSRAVLASEARAIITAPASMAIFLRAAMRFSSAVPLPA